MSQRARIASISVALLTLIGCEERPNCGTIFVYSPSERRCVCPAGAIYDGGTCIDIDAGTPESCETGAIRPCVGLGTGECDPGAQHCTDGAWGPCTGAIEAALETCNGRDDDCDGTIDGDSASASCVRGPRAGGALCAGGTCRATSCDLGFDDCDADSANGCESDLASDHDHCGSCGAPCSPSEACVERSCTELPIVGWERTATSTGDVAPYSAAFDTDGDLYVVGLYDGSASFEGRTIVAESESEVFIASYDRSGALRWLATSVGAAISYAPSIAVSALGDIAIVGTTLGAAPRFSGGRIEGARAMSGFVAVFSSAGALRRAIAIASADATERSEAFSVAFAADGRLVVGGTVARAATIRGIDFPAGGYLAAIDPVTLEIRRVSPLPGTPHALATFGSGLAVAGLYDGTIMIGEDVLTSVGSADIFIAWCDADLSCTDGATIGNVGFDNVRGLAVGHDGRAIVGGTDDYRAAFFASIARTGEITWRLDVGGVTDRMAGGVVADAAGAAYIGGTFSTEAVFGTTRLSSAGGFDAFLARVEIDGSVSWAEKLGGMRSERGYWLAGIHEDSIVLCGDRDSTRDRFDRPFREGLVTRARVH